MGVDDIAADEIGGITELGDGRVIYRITDSDLRPSGTRKGGFGLNQSEYRSLLERLAVFGLTVKRVFGQMSHREYNPDNLSMTERAEMIAEMLSEPQRYAGQTLNIGPLEPSDFRDMHDAIMRAQGEKPVSDDGVSYNAFVNSGILEFYVVHNGYPVPLHNLSLWNDSLAAGPRHLRPTERGLGLDKMLTDAGFFVLYQLGIGYERTTPIVAPAGFRPYTR